MTERFPPSWLIRRFIDNQAAFKFVDGKTHQPRKDDVRFDRFDAEFTHEGDRCSFETMIERLAIRDNALTPVAAKFKLFKRCYQTHLCVVHDHPDLFRQRINGKGFLNEPMTSPLEDFLGLAAEAVAAG